MKKVIASAVTALLATLGTGAALAGGHYVPGVEGVQAASVPPPGMYYLGYLVDYNIDNFRAPGSSDNLPGHNRGTVVALANRLAWVTNYKLLGADYGMEAIVPIVRTSLTINAAGVSDSRTGVGDIYLGPLILAWHGAQWDAVAGAGIWLDNASSSNPASAGKGYKSTMFSGGMTYYFDGAKTTSLSGLARYERNLSKNGSRAGDQVSLEWGLGKSFGSFNAGLVGYNQWQVSDDKGAGASTNRHARHAIGGEVTYPIPGAGVFLKGALYKEYSAKGGSGPEPKGTALRFTLVKVL